MRAYLKIDQKFLNQKDMSYVIVGDIRKILRSKFKKLPSAIKRIQNETYAHERAIRNWYEGRNPPSAAHLVVLCRTYPAILRAFLHWTGHDYLMEHVFEKNVPLNVTDQFAIDRLNERQMWIVVSLAMSHKLLPRDIARIWSVTERTAKRDLADLTFRGYITHQGSAKNGRYILGRANE
jgi:hypothetical protein